MATYESYKDSGVKWLGQIPSHWEVKKLRAFFDRRNTKVSDTDYQPLSVTKNGIIPQMENVAKSKDSNNRRLVKIGDFVINSRSDRKGSSGVSSLEGSVSFVNTIMTPRQNVVPAYCNYLLKSIAFVEENYRNGHGIVADLWTTSFDEQKLIKLAMPPMREQEAIVAYLDKTTTEIDRAIEVQQKMINALNERKQIIITRAVTRGLNPDAPLRDSGMDWLGQIPAHWDPRKIKFLARLKSGKNLTSEQISPEQRDNFHPVYGGNGVRGYYSKFNTSGDFAIIGRQGALCGNVNYAHGQFWATDHAVVCYPIFNFILLWFGETLKVANLNQYATQSAQPGLAVERVKNVSLPCPPKDEMLKIADYIQKAISEFSPAITHCERMISLLQERKQIIINEVVTGKKKVI